MKIRLFHKQDAEQIAQLFHQTVREVNSSDYSLAQVKAWAPDNIYFRNWAIICAERFTYVADNQGIIAGFGQGKRILVLIDKWVRKRWQIEESKQKEP